jgi:hypothetical protein
MKFRLSALEMAYTVLPWVRETSGLYSSKEELATYVDARCVLKTMVDDHR